jgi:AraC-like DNA-binding protein
MMDLGYQGKNRIAFSYNSTDADAKAQSFNCCLDTYNLVFVTCGSGRCVLEGREYPLTVGSVIISKPLEYYYIEIDHDARFERYVLEFAPQDLTHASLEMLESAISKSRCLRFLAKSYDALFSVFERSQAVTRLFDQCIDAYSRTLLSEIICLLSIARIELTDTNESEFGFKTIKYISEYLTRDLTLDFLSKKFFVSKYYLCRAFKKHNGVSVHGYILLKRVMLAKQLIDGGDRASVAAKRVGFRDYSAFYRAFVRIIGRPPLLTRI